MDIFKQIHITYKYKIYIFMYKKHLKTQFVRYEMQQIVPGYIFTGSTRCWDSTLCNLTVLYEIILYVYISFCFDINVILNEVWSRARYLESGIDLWVWTIAYEFRAFTISCECFLGEVVS